MYKNKYAWLGQALISPMKLLMFVVLALFVVISTHAKAADSAGTVAMKVTSTATGTVPSSAVVNPVWFNGNWLPYSKRTKEESASIEKQKADYLTAKQEKNLGQMVATAFWSSVQAWAYNNAGHRAITKYLHERNLDDRGNVVNSEVMKPILESAEALLLEGDSVLHDAPDLSEGPEYTNESNQRKEALLMIRKNLLFVQRCLGKKHWPRAHSEE